MKALALIGFFIMIALSPLPAFAQITGDVNGSGSVDIVDALLIAQYYVGLNPANFNAAVADVNCSVSVDIVDALLVAQYYVGLIASLPGCGGTPTPIPTMPPTIGPTSLPTATPTVIPTVPPTAPPTIEVTAEPTTGPTSLPTMPPTIAPTVVPTEQPPTVAPTIGPTAVPTDVPAKGSLAGDSWTEPEILDLTRGSEFSVSIKCNTGSQTLGSFTFEVVYDPSITTINASIGNGGVTAASGVVILNIDASMPALLRISGTGSGVIPGTSVQICTVNFISSGAGDFGINLNVLDFYDVLGASIGTWRSFGSTGTSSNAPGFCDLQGTDVWVGLQINPVFAVDLNCDTGTQKLGTFGVEVTYDPALIKVDLNQGIGGAVVDLGGYSITADASVSGTLRISGVNVQGQGPGSLSLCRIKFIGLAPGNTSLGLKVTKLLDETNTVIGTPRGFGSKVTVESLTVYDRRDVTPRLIWTGNNCSLYFLRQTMFQSQVTRDGYYTWTPYMVNFDVQGQRIGNQVALNPDQYAIGNYDADLVWNGSQYAYVWSQIPDSMGDSYHATLMFEILSASGAITKKVAIAENQSIAYTPGSLGIAWMGDSYAVIWSTTNPEGTINIYFTRLDASGNRLGADVSLGIKQIVSREILLHSDCVVWTGSEIRYFYYTYGSMGDQWNFNALSLDRNGTMLGDNAIVPASYTKLEAIAVNGNVYSAILYDQISYTYSLAAIDETGNSSTIGTVPLSPSIMEFNLSNFCIQRTGDGYGVSWKSEYDEYGNSYPIKLCILDASGNVLHRTEHVNASASSYAYWPSMIWTGTEYGIVYGDLLNIDPVTGGASGDIFFAHLDANGAIVGTDIRVADATETP
jgi:hypothetical protein